MPGHTPWRDRVLLAAAGIFCLTALPLVVPILSADARFTYSSTCTVAPLLILAIGVYRSRYRSAIGEERRFWGFLVAALCCWLAQQLFFVATWATSDAPWLSIVEDVLYAGLYLFMVLALDVQPHLPESADDRSALAALRRAGTVVFVFGLLIYLVMIPAALAPASYWAELPSFTLYIVLDGYLLLRTVGVYLRGTRRRRWRAVYGWLIATFALWLVLDSIEALMWAEVLPWINAGTAWDLPWMLPLLTLVVVGRAPELWATAKDEASAQTSEESATALDSGGSLILAAVLVPLLHLAVYRTGLFDDATRRAHETATILIIVALGGIVFAYQRRLEAHNRRLEAERREALARIEHQAYHDPLTGLPNRRLLSDRLLQAIAHASRRGERLALLFLDLDDFKAFNDSLGHAFGDELLRRIGQRLHDNLRASDTLARIGGDEFVVLAMDVPSRDAADHLVDKLLEALRKPMVLDTISFAIRASAGVALYPDDGSDETTLLRHADAAMYELKQGKRERTVPG